MNTLARVAAPDGGRVRRWAVPLLLAGVAVTALGPILVRLSEVGPTATAFYRFAFALPVFWVWGRVGRGHGMPARPMTARDRAWLAVAGLCFAADLAVWHGAILHTSIANASLLANFAPVLVSLTAWLWFGERMTPTFLAGLGITVAGASLVVRGSLELNPAHLAGDGLAVLAAVFYTGYLVAVKRVRAGLATATVMTWSASVSAAALLPITLVVGERVVAVTPAGWAVLLGLALVAQVGGQSLIAWALGHLPAGFASSGGLLQPVMGAGLAWLLLGESLEPRQIAGGLVVLGGLVVARPAPPR